VIGCATCGAAPTGTYNDGSPRYPVSCDHPPVRGDDTVSIDPYGRVIIELDPWEMTEAFACGKKRFDRAQARKAKDHFGQPSLDSHVLGAQGERAFAKWLGVPWECTVGRYGGAADVAGCQIRAVSDAKLQAKVRDSDPGRIPVVSIVASGARFWLRGWILARDAKRIGNVDDPGNRGAPAWFVKTNDLQPMSAFLASNEVRAALGRPPVGV
jgi:hypothetical protein